MSDHHGIDLPSTSAISLSMIFCRLRRRLVAPVDAVTADEISENTDGLIAQNLEK